MTQYPAQSDNSQMSKLFKELKQGFEEMIAHKEGKVTLCSEHVEIPSPPNSYSPKEQLNFLYTEKS